MRGPLLGVCFHLGPPGRVGGGDHSGSRATPPPGAGGSCSSATGHTAHNTTDDDNRENYDHDNASNGHTHYQSKDTPTISPNRFSVMGYIAGNSIYCHRPVNVNILLLV